MELALRRKTPTALSPGEVHFLWWFMQGSIMDPEMRRHLRLAWGMCDRHGVGALGAEALALCGPLARARLARRLRSRAACRMCELGYGPHSASFIARDRVEQGRNLSPLRAFLSQSRAHWMSTVCGRCSRSAAKVCCRLHLLEALRSDPSLDLDPHRSLVDSIYRRVRRCAGE